MRSIEDVKQFFAAPNTGTVETGVAQGWWLIHHYIPNIRAVVIHRPVEAVMNSMLAVDTGGVATYDEEKLRSIMQYGERMLEQISSLPGVLSIDFDSLSTKEGCAAIWERCLPYAFDEQHWLDMKDKNIQVDMKEFLSYYFANREKIEGFKRACWAELRAIYPNASKMRMRG